MKKMLLILLGLALFFPGCDDSSEETDLAYVQVFEKIFRNNQFPNTAYDLTKDTYISSLNPTTNYGSSGSLTITEFSTNKRRILINFRIGGYLPAEAKVTSAVLTFYTSSVSPEVAGESIPV